MRRPGNSSRKPPISVIVLRAAGREPMLKLEIALIGRLTRRNNHRNGHFQRPSHGRYHNYGPLLGP